MFKPETKILFQEPSVASRLLRSATVVASSDESFSVSFDGEPIEIGEGLELIAYFLGRSEFMQQIVRAIDRIEQDDRLVVVFEPIGDAVSAENRQASRAITIAADLFAALGEDRNLSIEDVSSTGFAVVSDCGYAMGSVLDVSLRFEGDIYSGEASVQSIRELGGERIRYGLQVLDDGDLSDGLQQISRALRDPIGK